MNNNYQQKEEILSQKKKHRESKKIKHRESNKKRKIIYNEEEDEPKLINEKNESKLINEKNEPKLINEKNREKDDKEDREEEDSEEDREEDSEEYKEELVEFECGRCKFTVDSGYLMGIEKDKQLISTTICRDCLYFAYTPNICYCCQTSIIAAFNLCDSCYSSNLLTKEMFYLLPSYIIPSVLGFLLFQKRVKKSPVNNLYYILPTPIIKIILNQMIKLLIA